MNASSAGCSSSENVALEPGEVGGGQRRHRDPYRDALERDPHDVELLGVVARQVGDPNAAVGLGHDATLALEHPQRLAQWRPTGAELVRQRGLRGRRASLDFAPQDRVAQALVDDGDVLAVPCSCCVDAAQLRRPCSGCLHVSHRLKT
jgi:hypothetical protein